jgi:AraC-like DNA-binding protein
MLVGRVPPPPLSAFIELLWYAAGWKPPHDRERHMPDGSVAMVILLGHGGAAGPESSMIAGARSEAIFLDTSRPATIIGVQFKRGGAGPFLDVPVSELTNTHAALGDVAGPVSLRDRLLEAGDPETRLDVLQQWLMQRLLRRPDRDPAIAWAVRQFEHQPHIRISAVADRIGRSSRWFIDRFATEVGLTPKVFSRVQRFQLALRQMHETANVDLADLAVDTGYFDQAHFSHDFRSIAGITPTAYLSARTDHPNHVRVVGRS